MKSDFLWIYNNKLDVSDSPQLTVTVSHRRHFCHFVTNSWLLRSGTQTHHLSLCVFVCVCLCVCASGGASEDLKRPALGPKNSFILLLFLSHIQPWISSYEVIKSNAKKETDWNIGMRWKGWNINQYMGNTEFWRCGGFYFAVAVRHSQLHVGETLLLNLREYYYTAQTQYVFYFVKHQARWKDIELNLRPG